MSGLIPHLSILQSPMFLLNSRLGHFSAALRRERPFSRSYGAILPSSLAVNHSSALVLYTRPPVSVCGTGSITICLAAFLGGVLHSFHFMQAICVLSGSTLVRICLHNQRLHPLTNYIRQLAEFSTPRPHIAHNAGNGILTVCPSGSPFGLPLGPD